MDPDFHFETGSSDEESEVEEGASQSPCEFAAYSESVAEEHARRITTSIDAKINSEITDRFVPLPGNEDEAEKEEEEEEESGEEADDAAADDSMKQEDQKFQGHSETSGEGARAFFAPSEGQSSFSSIHNDAKRAGSQLKSRIVAEQPIAEWSQLIEQMEDQFSAVLQDEREERILRKAEMEATKAENMIQHKDEIYSRPKRTWFVTEKEKKVIAKTAKASQDQNRGGSKEVISAQQAEEQKVKEKRRRECGKNLPRKKRQRLEAAREMLEDEQAGNDSEKKTGDGWREKTRKSLVEVAYRRAKSLKSAMRARESGETLKNSSKQAKQSSQKNQTRKEEMMDLFQNDMSEMKQARATKKGSALGRKKAKSSFKSKSRSKHRGTLGNFSFAILRRFTA